MTLSVYKNVCYRIGVGNCMNKLDNKGWGFTMFIVFLCILLSAILMVVYVVNNFETGLSPRRGDNLTYSQYETYRRYEKVVSKAASNYAKNEMLEYINIEDLELSDTIKYECIGYVLLNDDSDAYTSYLRCGNYESSGFSYDNIR